MEDPTRLARAADDAIDHPDNVPLVSAASVWEIAIKRGLGKLTAPDDMLEELAARDVGVLDVTADHAWGVSRLPRHHSDPFDRLLVAQALAEGLVLVTADPVFARYGVPVLPAT
jgi:PIN domain nuclease of toxin-antitoxin system